MKQLYQSFSEKQAPGATEIKLHNRIPGVKGIAEMNPFPHRKGSNAPSDAPMLNTPLTGQH